MPDQTWTDLHNSLSDALRRLAKLAELPDPAATARELMAAVDMLALALPREADEVRQ